MTSRALLLDLAAQVERAPAVRSDRTLNRAVARAVGWGYRPPAQMGRKSPGWFHPDDCRDGEPVLDSLHGTDVWREPLDYLGSLDAAMTLLDGYRQTGPDQCGFAPSVLRRHDGSGTADVHISPGGGMLFSAAATPPLALTAAALKALAAQIGESE